MKCQDSERDNYKVSHLPVERKERIAPPRLPNSKWDNSYKDSVELPEKAGASGGQMYHNGQWRDGYRVEGAGWV